MELRWYPANAKTLRLRRKPDFQQLDSLTREDNGSFRTHLKFQNLTSSRFLRPDKGRVFAGHQPLVLPVGAGH